MNHIFGGGVSLAILGFIGKALLGKGAAAKAVKVSRVKKSRLKKKILEEAYELDPAFPLIHLALAALEPEPERAAFLREFDLKRLPESCKYTNALDPAEITLEAAEMCGEQKDWPRVLIALEKYAKVGKWNPRSEALRARAEKGQSTEAN